MSINKINIPFAATNYFSKIAQDYAAHDENLRPFIQDFPSRSSLENQIQLKKRNPVDRVLLQQVIKDQYQDLTITDQVKTNLDLLLNDNTFTICAAHQPCIFTGPLYFFYKITNAIRLAQDCKKYFPEYDFVPVFYMGTEDNDIAEIGSLNIGEQKYQWQTIQKGACGRMGTDDLKSICNELLAMLDENVDDERWLIHLLKEAFLTHKSLTDATRILVNGLFGGHGLLILDADDARLKRQFKSIIEDELFQRTSHQLVEKTSNGLATNYKVQAKGREINLFYLKDNLRERIELKNSIFTVHNSGISFSADEMMNEIEMHPDHFSPNVILRPLYQEMLLPNVAFVGGGGEVAYWLELKKVFNHYQTPYPILILRNSFLLISPRMGALIKELGLSMEELFLDREFILKKILSEHHSLVTVNSILKKIDTAFQEIEQLGKSLSSNLEKSMKAHHAKSNRITNRIQGKFITHIKRNEQDVTNRVDRMKAQLFPSDSLQERHENFVPYFKIYGKAFIDLLIDQQDGIDSSFIILQDR